MRSAVVAPGSSGGRFIANSDRLPLLLAVANRKKSSKRATCWQHHTAAWGSEWSLPRGLLWQLQQAQQLQQHTCRSVTLSGCASARLYVQSATSPLSSSSRTSTAPNTFCCRGVRTGGLKTHALHRWATLVRSRHQYAPLHPGSSRLARRAGPHTAGCRPRCCRRCLGRSPTCSAQLKLQ